MTTTDTTSLDRLEALANQYARRAEIHARFADELPKGDGYRPMADADADEAHRYAADLRFALATIREQREALVACREAAHPLLSYGEDAIWRRAKIIVDLAARAALTQRGD